MGTDLSHIFYQYLHMLDDLLRSVEEDVGNMFGLCDFFQNYLWWNC